jgi:hypothetical protein
MFCHFFTKSQSAMKNVLYLFLVIFLIFSCSITQKVAGQQGISGKIIWLEGNLMPTIGNSANNNIKAMGIPITKLLKKAILNQAYRLRFIQ